MKEETKKTNDLCPLMRMAMLNREGSGIDKHTGFYCGKTMCSWWTHKGCAITAMSEALIVIARELSALNKQSSEEESK